eukprot:TRINITY_DN8659_c0_g1_i10.p1 TRINITY_DN8659_c0_g1~~TRINITY_DN8659_c0_g1_i10.p1  ORF type:complete len:100 (+),score=11.39 TRINITY_DN8659_c0_g1_i10:255-554(+)
MAAKSTAGLDKRSMSLYSSSLLHSSAPAIFSYTLFSLAKPSSGCVFSVCSPINGFTGVGLAEIFSLLDSAIATPSVVAFFVRSSINLSTCFLAITLGFK